MSFQPLRVLVVDDDGNDRSMIHSMLSETLTQIDLLSMTCGQELIDWLDQQRKAEAVSPPSATSPVTVILLDMQMPRQTGLDTLRAIGDRGQLAYMPVIMLSSSEDAQTKQQAYEQGIHLYMNKPTGYRGFYRVAEAVKLCYRDVQRMREGAWLMNGRPYATTLPGRWGQMPD